MKTRHIITILGIVLLAIGCETPNNEPIANERTILYAIDRDEGREMLKTDAEWDQMLDRFCDLAQEGHSVTFYNMGHMVGESKLGAKGTVKEATSFTTASRSEMKAWMKEMEAKGKTVNVTYNNETGMWNGTAYANAPVQPVQDNCFTGVIVRVPIPPISGLVFEGTTLALQINDDTTLILLQDNQLLTNGYGDDMFPVGDTMTLCGMLMTMTDSDDNDFLILNLDASMESLAGQWLLDWVATTTMGDGDELLSTTIVFPPIDELYTFTADGTASCTIGGTTTSGTWNLQEDGELCCDVLHGGNACWSINWLTGSTMVLSRIDYESNGEMMVYQMQLSNVSAQ